MRWNVSRREVVDCDRCGEKAVTSPIVVEVVTGRRPDPAGGGSEDDVERVDLCVKCAASMLQAVVARLDYDEGKKWHAEATKKKW